VDMRQLKEFEERLRAGAAKPRACTAKEAKAQNRLMRLFGVPFKPLKAGDMVYEAEMHPDVVRRLVND
jgi:hypothetical protein